MRGCFMTGSDQVARRDETSIILRHAGFLQRQRTLPRIRGRSPMSACTRSRPYALSCDQNDAIGFNGEPVPPRTGIGDAVMRNSQRPSFSHVSASASRSQLSKICTPIAFSVSK